MKFLNKYFSTIMLLVIFSTLFVYKSKQLEFIAKSTEHTVTLEGVNQEQKESLKVKLKNMTFQDVEIEEKEGITYIKMKCPPDRFGFFSKWILDKYKGEE